MYSTDLLTYLPISSILSQRMQSIYVELIIMKCNPALMNSVLETSFQLMFQQLSGPDAISHRLWLLFNGTFHHPSS